MRVVDAFRRSVRALTVSPDGRFLAAADDAGEVAVWDWASGGEHHRVRRPYEVAQLAFSPNSAWWAVGGAGTIDVYSPGQQLPMRLAAAPDYALLGAVAFSPDGKRFVASEATAWHRNSRLARWGVPDWKRADGAYDSDLFLRLAFSPDGQYVAGASTYRFELRIAVTGGLNGWGQPPPEKWGRPIRPRDRFFVTFSRDSQTLAAGWQDEFHVLDTRNGNPRRKVLTADAPVQDAAFTGSGRHLGTVHGSGELRLWDAETWQVGRTYDWRSGPLTRVAFTADGLAGVCGTASGRLVLFDLDE